MCSPHLIACYFQNLCSHDISEASNFRNAGSFALKDVRNTMLCLIGRSNWIGEHSLMKLLWLVNNVMIKALHTWQRNRSYRSNVFNLDTNESLFRWSLFFCCCLGDNRELCFNVTCQFCIGVSRTTDYARDNQLWYWLLSETSFGKCLLQNLSSLKVSMFVEFCGCRVSALCACAK